MMVPTRLKAAAQLSVYTKLKLLQEPKIPASASPAQRADADQAWQDIATAVAEAMADIITEVQSATVTVTVTSVTGVLGGGGTSGPGTGTGTIA